MYDGPDLADVAALTGLTEAEVIERHQAGDYRVGWLGFAPGFGYLTGLDPRLQVPRLDSPRLSVPAGAVAIAGGLAAVYPAASPGGWRLLGRTNAPLWDAGRTPPALLTPGQRVRFRAVGRLPDPPPPPLVPDLVRASPARSSSETHEIDEKPGNRAADGSSRWLEVLQPGPLTTIQDLGRPGLAHLGVPHSGAADAASFRLANQLAGNDEAAAALEVTLGRLALRFGFDAVVALAGAPVPVRLTAAGASPQGDPADVNPIGGTVVRIPAGAILRLGSPPAGLRTYLAVSGGIDVPPVLGSRSADVHSGLGPPALRRGDRLPVGRTRSRPGQQQRRGPALRPESPAIAGPAQITDLRVLAGPRDDWFSAGALAALAGGSYQVSAASNRTGLRLTGPVLRRARDTELPSEGMAAGSLQVTHDGQPILLLADHPTTGGYPVIAVVASADLGLAAQLRPGQRIRFLVGSGSG